MARLRDVGLSESFSSVLIPVLIVHDFLFVDRVMDNRKNKEN